MVESGPDGKVLDLHDGSLNMTRADVTFSITACATETAVQCAKLLDDGRLHRDSFEMKLDG